MSTVAITNFTTSTKADSAPTALTLALRDNNAALTNAGEIVNGNLFCQTENIQVNTISAPKTLDGTGGIWLCSGAITVTLPAVATVTNGRWYRIFKTDASNTVTIAVSDSATINGSATTTLTSQYQSKFLFTDGTNWFF